MDKLITSSSITRQWLNNIVSEVKKRISSVRYKESKHYASLKNSATGKIFVHLNPQPHQIRLFTPLDQLYDTVLRPSRSGWKHFLSVFVIKSEDMIDKAIDLIISSYEEDCHR